MKQSSPSVGVRRLIGVFGNSGTGKTQTLKALVRKWPRIFSFDRSKEMIEGLDVQRVASTRREVLNYLWDVGDEDDFSVAYQPGIVSPAAEAIELGFLARLALAARHCVLSVSEASRCCRVNLVDPATTQVALEGRKKFVSMIVDSQRPVHIDPDIRSEAYGSEVFLYRLARRADRKDAEEEHGKDFAESLSCLEDLHGFHVTQASGGSRIVKVEVVPGDIPSLIEGERE